MELLFLGFFFMGYVVKELLEIVYELVSDKLGEKRRDEESTYWNKMETELHKAYSKILNDTWKNKPEETKQLALEILDKELKINIVEMYDYKELRDPYYVLDEMLARRIVVAAKGGCIIEEDLDNYLLCTTPNYGRFTKTVYRHDKYNETYEHFKDRYRAQRKIMMWVEQKVKEAHPDLETLEMVFLETYPQYLQPRRYININSYDKYDTTNTGEYLWMPTANFLIERTQRVITWY